MKLLKLLSPFVLLLLCLFNPVKSWGQNVPVPDCGPIFVNQSITTGTTIPVPNATGFDNRTLGCQTWTFAYQANATSGTFTSIDFQSTNGAVTPGTYATWPGTVATGVNPNTNQTNGITTFTTGCVSGMACTTDDSWVKLVITRNNFVGIINGVLYGYKSGYPGGGSGSSAGGCVGTAATPCVVDGPTAAGAAPTTPPVLVAGQDGAPGSIRTIKTDASGQPIPSNASSADADGVSNTEATQTGAAGGILYPRVFNRVFNGATWDRMVGNTTGVAPTNASVAGADAVSNTSPTPTNVAGGQIYQRSFPYVFNGTTNDRQFSCIFQAVSVLAPGTTRVIVGTMGKTTKICHYHASINAASDVTISSGTGSLCGTGTATIDSFKNVTTFAMDFSPLSPMKANASGDDICFSMPAGTTSAALTVIYAQY